MNKYIRFFITISAMLMMSTSVAQQVERVIYKWRQNGLIYYSHIKPYEIMDYEKLDNQGRRIQDFPTQFDEVIKSEQSVIVRPNAVTDNDINITGRDLMLEHASQERAKTAAQLSRQNNCQTARDNLQTLRHDEVYEQDESGNMIKLDKAAIEARRQNSQKDIEYFCQ